MAFAGGVEPRARARVLELDVGGGDSVLVARATRELVGRLGLELRVAVGPNAQGDALFRATVDQRAPGAVRVTVIELATGATLVVRELRGGGSATVLAEQIAHVIQAAVESALATSRGEASDSGAPAAPETGAAAAPDALAPSVSGAAVPRTDAAPESMREAPAPDAGVATRESARAKGFAVDAVAIVDGIGFADAAGVVFGAGGGVRLAFGRAVWRPSFLATVVFHPTVGVVDPAVELRTTITSIRALWALSVLDTRWVGLEGGLGLGLDVLDVSPRQGGVSRVVPASGTTDVSPVLRAGVGAELRLLPWAALFAMMAADVDLQPHRYVVDRAGAFGTALEPWRARPALMFGVRVALFEPKVGRAH